MPPRGKTPGLKIGRNNLRYWIARQVVRDPMGFPDKSIPLPQDADGAAIEQLCEDYTARLRAWIDEQEKGGPKRTRYDGTVLSLCRLFQEHPDSSFHEVKANSRATYTDSLKVIENTVGQRAIRHVTIIDVKRWYKMWKQPKGPGGKERIERAHSAVTMLRMCLRFAAALKHKECADLADALKMVRFEGSGAREQEMTYTQAGAFIRKALEMGNNGVIPLTQALSMAIGTAGQFDLMVRQRDIIGEWAPAKIDAKNEAIAQVFGDEMWTGYFTWERVPGWRWRMKTSKSKFRSPAEFDLQNYSLLFPLLEQVPHQDRIGAIIKGKNGLPVKGRTYREWFRQIARAAGIPDDVWSMDSRAGGATEAEEAGATIEAIQGALTHAKPGMTMRYIRRRSTKIASVAQARTAKRVADDEGGK